jgi:hypothetical protein
LDDSGNFHSIVLNTPIQLRLKIGSKSFDTEYLEIRLKSLGFLVDLNVVRDENNSMYVLVSVKQVPKVLIKKFKSKNDYSTILSIIQKEIRVIFGFRGSFFA